MYVTTRYSLKCANSTCVCVCIQCLEDDAFNLKNNASIQIIKINQWLNFNDIHNCLIEHNNFLWSIYDFDQTNFKTSIFQSHKTFHMCQSNNPIVSFSVHYISEVGTVYLTSIQYVSVLLVLNMQMQMICNPSKCTQVKIFNVSYICRL